MQKMFCEPLNEEEEPLAFFAVWVKDDETPKPTTCYLDQNATVPLSTIELVFPHQNWARTAFYKMDIYYEDCVDPDRTHHCLEGGKNLSH